MLRTEGWGDVLEGVTEMPMDSCMDCDLLGCSTTQSDDFGAHVHTNHRGSQIDDLSLHN